MQDYYWTVSEAIPEYTNDGQLYIFFNIMQITLGFNAILGVTLCKEFVETFLML